MIHFLFIISLLINTTHERLFLLLPDLPYASIEFVNLEAHRIIGREFPRFKKKFPLSTLASKEVMLPKSLLKSGQWILSAKTLHHQNSSDSNSSQPPISFAVGKSEKDGRQTELTISYSYHRLIIGRVDPGFDLNSLLPELEYNYDLHDVKIYKFAQEGDSRFIAFYQDTFLIADSEKHINYLVETNLNLRPELELNSAIHSSLEKVNQLKCPFWQISFSRHHFEKYRETAVRQQATDETIESLDQRIATMPLAKIHLVFIDDKERIIQRAVSLYENEDQAVEAHSSMTSAYIKSLVSSKKQHKKTRLFDVLLGNTATSRAGSTVLMDIVLSKELDEESKLFEESQKSKK
jgi:hypothetical protein